MSNTIDPYARAAPFASDPILDESKEIAYVNEKQASSIEEGSQEEEIETLDDHDV